MIAMAHSVLEGGIECVCACVLKGDWDCFSVFVVLLKLLGHCQVGHQE